MNLIESIVAALRFFGPLNAEQMREKLALRGDIYSVDYLVNVMFLEDSRDWRSRRLRRATGYPDALPEKVVYISP